MPCAATTGERWSFGFAGAVVGAGTAVPPGATPPGGLAAFALVAQTHMTIRLQTNALLGPNRKTDYLFRRPAGLADGLALKEPALSTESPWNSPQQSGSPVPRYRIGDSALAGTLANCNDGCR